MVSHRSAQTIWNSRPIVRFERGDGAPEAKSDVARDAPSVPRNMDEVRRAEVERLQRYELERASGEGMIDRVHQPDAPGPDEDSI